MITCFQTIEHVPDLLVFCRDAAGLTAEGGVLAFACHNPYRDRGLNGRAALSLPIGIGSLCTNS